MQQIVKKHAKIPIPSKGRQHGNNRPTISIEALTNGSQGINNVIPQLNAACKTVIK